MATDHVTSIRIDVPLRKTATLHFFVWPNQATDHVWWNELFVYLLRQLPNDGAWVHEEAQNVFYKRRSLSDEETQLLLTKLRAAPAEELAGHRTLRKSIERLSQPGVTAALAFFTSHLQA